MARVDVYSIFETDTLRTREAADHILEKADDMNSNEVILDFAKIYFVSRSFSHELQTAMKKSPKRIRVINTNKNINRMFKVALRKPKIIYKAKKVPVISFL